MDIPVSQQFVESCNAAQLHSEAQGAENEWPASFVQVAEEEWVYRVDAPGGRTEAEIQAAVVAHVPDPDFGKPAEETTLKTEMAQRLQTLDDATKTKASWDGLTAAQRQEAVRQGLQLLVRLTRFVGKGLL